MRDEKVEIFLMDRGINDYHLREVDVDTIDLNTSLDRQIRTEQNSARVDEYKRAWKSGVDFPAVLLMKNGKRFLVVDGNRRTQAATLAKKKTISAYVIPYMPEGGFFRLAYAANFGNGDRPTEHDTFHAIVDLHRTFGMSAKQIRKDIPGLSESYIGEVLRQQATLDKLKEAGKERLANKLGRTHVRRLCFIKSVPVLVKAAEIIVNSQLTQASTLEMLRGVKESNSDAEALERLDEFERDLVSSSNMGNGQKLPNGIVAVNRHAGGLISIGIVQVEQGGRLVTGDVRQKTLERIGAARERLNEFENVLR